MKTKLAAAFLGLIVCASLLMAANLTTDVAQRTTRYRTGSVITFDTSTTIQDEDADWSFSANSTFRLLSQLVSGTNDYAFTIADTNGLATLTTNNTKQVTIKVLPQTNGLTTNIQVVMAGIVTNTLCFTNGLLKNIQ